jgi:hypothetical protein
MWWRLCAWHASATGLAAYGTTRAHPMTRKPRKIALQEVGDCPAGRLVLHDKAGNLIEPEFEPSIGLVLDPVVAELGPLWVRGGIPIESSDGYVYETATGLRCAAAESPPTSLSATAGIPTENSPYSSRRKPMTTQNI